MFARYSFNVNLERGNTNMYIFLPYNTDNYIKSEKNKYKKIGLSLYFFIAQYVNILKKKTCLYILWK